MITVLIHSSGDEIDVLDGKLTYVIQTSDIGDISKTNASYSWKFSFPKTPINTKIFKGLGIVGDTSRTPYEKIYCSILDSGYVVEEKGLLMVKETKENYNSFIQAGIVEFFKDVSTDKISEVVDLSELDHQNSIGQIIDSFTNTTYRYIISDYNGKPLPDFNGITSLKTSSLIPSINMLWLFDKIFEHYNWTYSGNFDLSDRWMTYPSALVYDDTEASNVFYGNAAESTSYIPTTGFVDFKWGLITNINNDYFTLSTDGKVLTCQQTVNCKIEMFSRGQILYEVGPDGQSGIHSRVKKNGNTVLDSYSGINNDGEIAVLNEIVIEQGDEILVRVFNESLYDGEVNLQSESVLSISILGTVDVSFSEALIKYKVADWFKEVMMRFALTAFTSIADRHIHFLTVEERLNADIVNWSRKYVKRKSEKYVYNSYAKENFYRHQYDEKDDDYNDGKLTVQNENLAIEKTIYKSVTYAPLEELTTYKGVSFPEYFVNNFKMFDVEVKEEEDESGDIITITKYKPLKNRFYIMQDVERVDSLYLETLLVPSFPLAKISGNTFKDIVPEKYSEINDILNDTKIHSIELALSKADVLLLDLEKRYYFEQEKQVYLFNKLTWKSGKIVIGEFIRLNN